MVSLPAADLRLGYCAWLIRVLVCSTCGEYIYKGKKFNARKETVQGEEYYGIKVRAPFSPVWSCLSMPPLTYKNATAYRSSAFTSSARNVPPRSPSKPTPSAFFSPS